MDAVAVAVVVVVVEGDVDTVSVGLGGVATAVCVCVGAIGGAVYWLLGLVGRWGCHGCLVFLFLWLCVCVCVRGFVCLVDGLVARVRVCVCVSVVG